MAAAQGPVPVDWISGVMIDYARANPSTLAAIVTLGMRAFTLGRNTAKQSVTVDVGSNFPAVSRRHAVIVAAGPDRYQIIDLDSTNGTEVWENGRWKNVTQAVISSGQAFRLGRQFETSVAALARLGYKVRSSRKPARTGRRFFGLAEWGLGVCFHGAGNCGGWNRVDGRFSDYALVGVLGAIFGHDAATEFRQFVMIASPVCSIVGGAIVLNNPGIGGMLMAANAAALPPVVRTGQFPDASGSPERPWRGCPAFLSMRDAIADWVR